MKCYLKQVRKEKGYSQIDLSTELCVAQTTVSEWENGNNIPNLKMAYKVAEILDVEVTDIWKNKKKN